MTTQSRWRIACLALLVGGLALGIGARLYFLQVVRCERFRARAEHQHRSQLVIPATRGAIVDRHGEPLAISMEALSLFAHPRRVEDPAGVARLLAPAIGVPRRQLLARLRSDKPFVWLARFLEPEQAEAVRRLDLPLGENGPLGFEPEPKRCYPRGKLAVHVVGYATIDGDGVEGIESQYDEALKGDPTVYLVLQDARNGRQREPISEPRKQPRDVVLTIDFVLQHLVERELDRAMRETGARAATAILMDPRSGEILALANRPAADANRFGQAREEERRNRALVNAYEPGSTFKIVTMAAALERGKLRTGQRIFCENGEYRAGARTIHDVGSHGLLTPRQILEKSSNIGIVKISERLTARELLDTVTGFGFGAKTGIELPGESAGLLEQDPSRWSAFSKASIAFGQEVGVTAVQMVAATAAIANDGLWVRPRLVRGTRESDGRLELEPSADAARRVLSTTTARELGRMLESVVRTGTGRQAAVPGYRVAGKSGTAQQASAGGYAPDVYVASFCGYAPVAAPRLVGLVMIDTPRGPRHQGGQVAAPVFGRILADALRHVRAPADEDRIPTVVQGTGTLLTGAAAPQAAGRPRRAPVPGQVPDVVGLSAREAIATLAAHDCSTVVHGSGIVQRQSPPPGTLLQPGGSCTLQLAQRPASRDRRAGGRSSS